MGAPKSPSYGKRMANEISSFTFWRDILAEMVATFSLVAVQCAVPLSWGDTVLYGGTVQIALTMGFVVTVLIEAFGEMGGAHMNPAVTVSMVVANQITIIRGCLYILVQCVGAVGGAAFIYRMTPEENHGSLARTHVSKSITQWQGMLIEMFLTFLLVQTIWGAINKRRRKVVLPSLVIGLAVTVDIMTGIYYTGSSMNPARSLGPALVTNNWEDHWVYWVGPILGSLLATLIYHFLLDKVGSNDLPDDAEAEFLQSVYIEVLERKMKQETPSPTV